MALTLDQIVARVQGQFDASDAQVAAWVNERQARMVSESLWRAVTRTIATTVAGQSTYALDDEMVDLRALRVGSVRYGAVGRDQIWALEDPEQPASLQGPGVYAPAFDEDGAASIELYPPPSSDGDVIEALMAFEPPELVAGTDVPVIPAHLHSYLLDGVIASAYEQLDGRWDLAERHEASYSAGVQLLEREKNSRYQGGPVQAQVAGYHFRSR